MRRRAEMEVGTPAPALLDVNQQDYSTLATAALGMQSRVPGHLDRRISLGVQLDDWTRPEFWRIRAGSRWQAYRSATAVALQRGFVQIQGGNGTLTVLERVIIGNNSGAALSFLYGITAFEAAAGGGGTVTCDDRDWNLSTPGAAVTWGTAVAPAAPSAGYILVPNGTVAEVPVNDGIILTGKPNPVGVVPVWKVCANAVNVGFEVTLFWRERFILPSEI